MAPEIHLKPTETADITKQDVWAIGVIAYEICNFTLPFTGSNALSMIRAVVEDPPKPFVHQGYSAELKDQLLTKDPAQRPSIKQVV